MALLIFFLDDPAEQLPHFLIIMHRLRPCPVMIQTQIYFQPFRLGNITLAGSEEDMVIFCIFLPMIIVQSRAKKTGALFCIQDALLMPLPFFLPLRLWNRQSAVFTQQYQSPLHDHPLPLSATFPIVQRQSVP